MRLTKIICTLGPVTGQLNEARKLAKGGMNIARLNFSHGSLEEHLGRMRNIQQLNKEGFPIAIMIDTKGAEIRTGDVTAPIPIKVGQKVIFSFKDIKNTDYQVIRVSYPEFAKDIKKAERILIDNGEILFDIVKINKDGTVIAKSQDDGMIGNRRHVNLPGADISLPSMLSHDWKALEMGCKEKADFVALSFVRSAKEVKEVRDFIKKKKGNVRIISKIETRQAVADIDNIIDASDAIMVARGDLGAEMPFEKIPVVQDDIVFRCREAGKPVIVATHMLESMIKNPLPTRAEVTDIAHAAVTRADSTMLSGEAANGKFPYRSLQVMNDVLVETEKHIPPAFVDEVMPVSAPDVYMARAAAAVSMAQAMNADAIVALTLSGKTAHALSMLRPGMPIIACTPNPGVQQMLQLNFGVYTLPVPFSKDADQRVKHGLDAVKKSKLLKAKSNIVLVSNMDVQGDVIGTIQARLLP